MKTKLIFRTMGLLIMMASLFVLSSCTKQADKNLTEEQKEQQGENLEASSIDETDFTESDEDLTTVDYKEFYDQLSAHGEWVQVVQFFARESHVRYNNPADDPALGNHVSKDLDVSLTKEIGHFAQFQTEANIRLVVAEAHHSFGIGQVRKRCRRFHSLNLLTEPHHHPFG